MISLEQRPGCPRRPALGSLHPAAVMDCSQPSTDCPSPQETQGDQCLVAPPPWVQGVPAPKQISSRCGPPIGHLKSTNMEPEMGGGFHISLVTCMSLVLG
ncbi:Macrophage Stimulating 1-Like Protein-Like [Manis pentadactyla]|nr:Macrophage Stimulating 1-Like Protein-Like [Manis pentadactyla]